MVISIRIKMCILLLLLVPWCIVARKRFARKRSARYWTPVAFHRVRCSPLWHLAVNQSASARVSMLAIIKGYTHLSTRRTLRSFDEASRKSAGIHAGYTSNRSTPEVTFFTLQTLYNTVNSNLKNVITHAFYVCLFVFLFVRSIA